MIRERPIAGVGTGGFPIVYAERVKGTGRVNPGHPHSEYILMTAQLGVFGLAAFVGLLVTHWRVSRRVAPPLDRSLASGLVLAMAVGCLFNTLLLDHSEGLFYCWLGGVLFAGIKAMPGRRPARCDRAGAGRQGFFRGRESPDGAAFPAAPIRLPPTFRATMKTISAYVIAFNEADKIEAAVSSVLWADEVILVDSGSTDGTAEIAARLGARVVQIPFKGFGDLRNRALAECTCDWIFSLDSDERCTAETRDEILRAARSRSAPRSLLRAPPQLADGRMGQASAGWYPNYRQPQLFKRGALSYTLEPVHEGYMSHSEARTRIHP